MTEEQRQEREDWEGLLASDGWKRFAGYVSQEWTSGEAFKRRVLASVQQAGAVESAAQVMAASRAIESVLGYPKSRLTALARPEAVVDRFKDQRRVP